MLGSLARWLRLLGYDAELDTVSPDGELARRAEREGRWLLTRDRRLAAAGPRSLLVRSEDVNEQLAEVLGRLGLEPGDGGLGTRCSACNGEVEPVPGEAVQGLVPEHVWRTAREFRRCARCGRVYWRGSHVERIEARIAELRRRLAGAHD